LHGVGNFLKEQFKMNKFYCKFMCIAEKIVTVALLLIATMVVVKAGTVSALLLPAFVIYMVLEMNQSYSSKRRNAKNPGTHVNEK